MVLYEPNFSLMFSIHLFLICGCLLYHYSKKTDGSTQTSKHYHWGDAEAYNPEASNFPLCVKNHARVFLAGAAVQSETRKVILPKYGIREFKAKNFELATLIHVISTAERNRFVA